MKAKITNKINLKDYSGVAYVGIDVHRLSYSIAIVVRRVVIKKCKMPADSNKLVYYLKKLLPKARLYSVYECGFSGYFLHRTLEQSGINNIIVNPASIQVASKNRVKTDKLDSIKLAEHLSLGLLKGIRIRSIEEENQRLLSRTRRMLIKDRVRMMIRVRMKFLQFNLIPLNYRQTLTLKKAQEFLKSPQVSAELNHSLLILIRIWGKIEDELKEIKKSYQVISKSSELVQQYLQVPGIGINTAIVLADELGDCSQFRNQKSLFSFLGLTPSEHSSGDKIRKGAITRQGDPTLRAMLTESAWTAIRCDPAMKSAYSSIAARRGAHKAIIAIARKLIGRARSIILNKTNYELNYTEFNQQKKAA